MSSRERSLQLFLTDRVTQHIVAISGSVLRRKACGGETMYLVWLTALVLGSGFAISGGHKIKGKLLNLFIILGCMGLGFGIGYAAGLGSGNMGRIPDVGVPFSMMFGIVAAFGCVSLNNWRQKYDGAPTDSADVRHATGQQPMGPPPKQSQL